MVNSASELKKVLTDLIHNLTFSSSLYVKNPGKDFTRERKLSLEKVIAFILCMGGGNLTNELMNHFGCTPDLVTTSAFVQQRKKLLPIALETLFHAFVKKTDSAILYDGYRLLAVDGSALQIPTDKNDTESFYPGASNQKAYNLLHINAMYDLLRHVYTDAILQKGRVRDEDQALIDMVDRATNHPAILLADRSYESYNVFAHIQEKGWHYLIRIKDHETNVGITQGLDLPNQDEYDVPVHLLVTRRQTKEAKKLATDRNHYKIFYNSQKLDFLPPQITNSNSLKFYPFSFRIVRFKLSDSTYETVITNLDKNFFPPKKLKQFYAMRWGIETSFRHLKHTIGLLHFHAKKAELIYQEIFSRLIVYNFTKLIVSFVNIRQKYVYKVNFSVAVHICRRFLSINTVPSGLESLIAKFISPIVRADLHHVSKKQNLL
jgi:hypothetical protein